LALREHARRHGAAGNARGALFTDTFGFGARAAARGRGAPPSWFDGWFASCVTRTPEERFANAAKAFASFDRLCDTPAGETNSIGMSAARYDAPPSASRTARDISQDVIPPAPSSIATWPTEVAPSASGPIAQATLNRSIANTNVAAGSKPIVRPGFLIAVAAVLAVAVGTVFHFRSWFAPEPVATPHELSVPNLSPELASTRGAEWFGRVKTHCNPVEVSMVIQRDPPPPGKDGAGFAAACYAIAGKIDRAKATLDAVPEEDRAWASDCVFEVVHPIADEGDDAAAGPAMRLVLDYWPDNYMALYHAGMSEFATQHPVEAKKHLKRFLEIYKNQDGFTASATKVLDEISGNPTHHPDCQTPLTTDPEGRKIYPAGCKKPD
jgi:hypothetical protein